LAVFTPFNILANNFLPLNVALVVSQNVRHQLKEVLMKNDSSSKYNNYLVASFVMFLGLVYNVFEQDFIGSGVFLVSAIVFLSLGIIKNRAKTKESSAE
jgi:hypothetical protein